MVKSILYLQSPVTTLNYIAKSNKIEEVYTYASKQKDKANTQNQGQGQAYQLKAWPTHSLSPLCLSGWSSEGIKTSTVKSMQ